MLGKLSLSAVRGPKDHLDNLLAGSDGENILAELKKFVKRQPCWEINRLDALSNDMKREENLSNFSIWKTVRLGRHKTGDEYRRALDVQKYEIGHWAKEILSNSAFTCATEETDVDLVIVSSGQLGLKRGTSASFRNIYARALERGLELCPAEVGPALRLAYKDQPRGERLIIAMNAISGSAGDNYVFRLNNSYGETLLAGLHGHPDLVWGEILFCVFVKPRK